MKRVKRPWYIKVLRELWSKPPVYLRGPDGPSDQEGLRALLDSLSEGKELIYIDEMIDGNEAISFSINDLITGRLGNDAAHTQVGIPQKGKPLWGMRINQATWDRAMQEIERIPFLMIGRRWIFEMACWCCEPTHPECHT